MADEEEWRLTVNSSWVDSLRHFEFPLHITEFSIDLLNATHFKRTLEEIRSLSNTLVLKTFPPKTENAKCGTVFIFEVDVIRSGDELNVLERVCICVCILLILEKSIECVYNFPFIAYAA